MEVKIALIKDRFSSMEVRQILTELAILQNQHRFCHVTVNTSYKISWNFRKLKLETSLKQLKIIFLLLFDLNLGKGLKFSIKATLKNAQKFDAKQGLVIYNNVYLRKITEFIQPIDTVLCLEHQSNWREMSIKFTESKH